ncbi:MAG: NAD-dependent epimerase/dehydratase family protein [Candidatus Sericytochromatia bacterium]
MILLTGATGCVGSYLATELLQYTGERIALWVRDAAGLPQAWRHHPRIEIWEGGLEALGHWRPRLAEVSSLMHPATAWGGPDTFATNLRAQQQLIQALDPAQCRHLHLFSTASLLDAQQAMWPDTLLRGTDYIRSKAAFRDWLTSHPPQIPTSLYAPTVILGGGKGHRPTPVSAALPGLGRYLPLLQAIQPDGYVHLIHARDIARIVLHRHQRGLPAADLVLGNPALELPQLAALLFKIYASNSDPRQGKVPLKKLLPGLLPLLGPWMSDWDRFSLRQRHLHYAHAVSARDYALPEDLVDSEALLRRVLADLQDTHAKRAVLDGAWVFKRAG